MEFSKGKKFSYGILDLGQNAFLNIVGFYFLFYMTDHGGIPPVLAGFTLLIGKIWDAVTDPVVGHWSDRSVSPMGRRRPFILAGTLTLGFFLTAMFSVPRVLGTGGAFLYVTFFYMLASTSFTLMNIPYQAMLPELVTDFDERTSVIAWRMAFAVIGTFAGAGAVTPLVELFGSSGWSGASAVIGALVTVTGLITVVFIKEPLRRTKAENLSLFKSLKHVLFLKPFLLALFPWVLFNLGVAVVQASLVYFFTYLIGDASLFQPGILALLVFALLSIPLYAALSKKIDKKGSYITGMVVMSVFLIAFAFATPALPLASCIVVMAAAGIGLGAHYVMPHSILPDVIEWDSVETGERREGIFTSVWTFTVKAGQALALGITGAVLQFSGYVPDVEQSEKALAGIQVLVGVIPVIIIFAGILILRHYPISREFYKNHVLTKEPRNE